MKITENDQRKPDTIAQRSPVESIASIRPANRQTGKPDTYLKFLRALNEHLHLHLGVGVPVEGGGVDVGEGGVLGVGLQDLQPPTHTHVGAKRVGGSSLPPSEGMGQSSSLLCFPLCLLPVFFPLLFAVLEGHVVRVVLPQG